MAATFARQTNHNPDAFWNSTGRNVWDKVMAPFGQSIDNIGLEDLEGDNSIQLMSEFVSRCKSSPPISNHTKTPFKGTTLQDTIREACKYLQSKFSSQLQNLFPEAEVARWRRQVKDGQTELWCKWMKNLKSWKIHFRFQGNIPHEQEYSQGMTFLMKQEGMKLGVLTWFISACFCC